MVNALLQIASQEKLIPYIPVDLWSWLTKRPSLPPVCKGRYDGTDGPLIEAVRALNDIEVLKSYFLLVWSEWDRLYDNGFHKMRTSILEDFSGTGMGQRRTDLIQRLDRVLGQLDHGLEYLAQHNPDFTEDDLQKSKGQYGKLRETLLRVNVEAINRTPHLTIKTLCVLTHALDAHRTSHDIHVCTPSTISIVAG